MVIGELIASWNFKVIIYLAAFIIIAVASGQIAEQFKKIKLPLITGFLIIGLLSGPELLGLIDREAINSLHFLNDIALAFIAFAVGSELYLKDLRSKIRSIVIMTVSQIFITFFLVSGCFYLLGSFLPFTSEMNTSALVAISLLAGTIAIARSPSSAIAIINELRARGPFTQKSIGVTVIIDFAVIILFAVIFTISKSMIKSAEFKIFYIIQVFAELLLAVGFGLLIWLLLRKFFSLTISANYKKLLVLSVGFLVYFVSSLIRNSAQDRLGVSLHIEPMLVCIIGSFLFTNYSEYKNDFIKIIKETGPLVYIVFFTLTGAMISVEVVISFWFVSLIIFGVRIISLIIASYTGSLITGDDPLCRKISWMPYITQAGVSVGLATIIANEYTEWGPQFAIIMISVIVLNQFIGPPLFKWSLHLVKESHLRPDGSYDAEKKVIIFGHESQSQALAQQLHNHNWNVIFSVMDPSNEMLKSEKYSIKNFTGTDIQSLRELEVHSADTIVCLLTDELNYEICETAYENCGTNHMIARLNDRKLYKEFHNLGVMIIEPNTAMVSLMEHFVRSPIATSLLLGMEENQDTMDIEINNPDFHGLTLRDLRLPNDVIILSVSRGEHPIISHGYTRLRKGDVITLVGCTQSLEEVQLKLDGT
ncbi:MAG: cation:proton antiporter [Bacteroidales bacterium]|nr:cation:proton antiporter [Bacteroidales bacterium]